MVAGHFSQGGHPAISLRVIAQLILSGWSPGQYGNSLMNQRTTGDISSPFAIYFWSSKHPPASQKIACNSRRQACEPPSAALPSLPAPDPRDAGQQNLGGQFSRGGRPASSLGVVARPVLGMVARQFSGWSPSTDRAVAASSPVCLEPSKITKIREAPHSCLAQFTCRSACQNSR